VNGSRTAAMIPRVQAQADPAHFCAPRDFRAFSVTKWMTVQTVNFLSGLLIMGQPGPLAAGVAPATHQRQGTLLGRKSCKISETST